MKVYSAFLSALLLGLLLPSFSPRHLGAAASEKKDEKKKKEEPPHDGAQPKDAGSTTAPDEPPFDRLLEINSAQLFGGKAKVTGEELEVIFNADGEMKAGFEGKGIIDSKSDEMRGVNRNFIVIDKKDNVEVLVPGLAAVGMGDGVWTSRFPVAGKPWVELGMRVPNLIGSQSNIKVRVNWDKNSGYETNFFNSVSFVSGGSPKGTQVTSVKEYQPPAHKWFPRKDRKAGLKVGFGIKDGKCSVYIGPQEIATLPKVADKGGKVSIVFSKLTFTLDNLKISGKLDRKWAEHEIAGLRKSGKLKLKEEPPPIPGQ